jgi:WD40 repeat protein
VDKTAQLWIVATGEPYRRPLQHDDSVEVVAFSPDGKLLLTGTAGKIAQLWDVATGERCGRPLEHLDMVFTAAFCPPDGKKVLTGSADKKARLWDAATGALLRTYSHQGPVRAVAFSPDGETVLTGSWDKTARLWQTISGKPLGPPFAHEHRVRAVAFGLDGKTILTGSIGGTARLSRAPAALEGTPERILLWTQLVTGMKVDGSGMVEVMDSQDWHRHRRSMED